VPPSPELRRARAAICAVFFVNGVVFSSLFARMPAVKSDLDLSDGQLGLALLFSTVALLVSQPGAGALSVRVGSRGVMLAGGLGYSLVLALPALMPSLGLFALTLFALGFSNGALDVSMNTQGARIEKAYGRPLLSSMHAAFSFGALAGSGVGGLVAAAGVAPEPHLACVAVAGAAVMLAAYPFLLPPGDEVDARGPLFARPSRALAALGALAFAVLLSEGSITDWSAVYLRDSAGASEGLAAAGLAAFSLTMAIGRLSGDTLVMRTSPVALARGGGLLAAGGLGLGLVAATPGAGIAGFALMGLGLSAVFPLVVSAASRRPDMPAGPAIAAVSTTGYGGFIVGPAVIGLLAELSSLRAALLLPLVLCVSAALLAPALRD
jgi:MFS family permease